MASSARDVFRLHGSACVEFKPFKAEPFSPQTLLLHRRASVLHDDAVEHNPTQRAPECSQTLMPFTSCFLLYSCREVCPCLHISMEDRDVRTFTTWNSTVSNVIRPGRGLCARYGAAGMTSLPRNRSSFVLVTRTDNDAAAAVIVLGLVQSPFEVPDLSALLKKKNQ